MNKAFSKIWIIFIIIFIVGGFFYYLLLKQKPQVPEINDAWYKQQAIKNNDPSFCEKISKESVKESCFVTLIEKIPSENNISITHTQENNKNTLIFEIDFKDYFVKSMDLSKFGSNFPQYGFQSIIPLKFDFSPKLPFLRIETDIAGEMCKPETPYLSIEVDLPLNSEVKADLIDFQEKKVEEKLEIIPTIVCEKGGKCFDCPTYLKENEFFPPEFLIWPDKSRFDEKETLRVNFPLFRHNPAIRETYRIEKAKIKVDYILPEYSTLILEKEKVPSEISTETFNVSYKVTNPTLKELKDLKIKTDLDKGASMSYSPEFNIDADSSKTISFEVESLWYPGSILMDVSIISDSKLLGVGSGEWVRFSEREGQTMEPAGLVELNSQNFSEKTKSETWAVYFWEPDCPHCGVMKPILEELAKETKEIKFGKVNVKENLELLEKFYKFIYGTPGILLIKDGTPIDSRMGKYSKEELRAWLVSKIE